MFLARTRTDLSLAELQREARGTRTRDRGAVLLMADAADDAACSVQNLAGRGRGVVAERPLEAGEILLQEVPLAAVVLEEFSSTVCHQVRTSTAGANTEFRADVCSMQCFSAVRSLTCCPGCRAIGWCGEACQRVGAEAHQRWGECAALARLDTDILRDADAALAKLFVKLLCRCAMEAAEEDGKGLAARSLALLESNEEAVSDERASDLAMIAEVVLDAVPPHARSVRSTTKYTDQRYCLLRELLTLTDLIRIEQEELEAYMCAEQCNSFGVNVRMCFWLANASQIHFVLCTPDAESKGSPGRDLG